MKLAILAILLSLSTARAQMGWTLKQCRQHFGHELWMEDDAYMEQGGPAFGMKYHGQPYHYYTREENLAKDTPAFWFPGMLATVSFDSDQTVGKIWWRVCGQWSDQEIKGLLRRSAPVAWIPAPESPTIESVPISPSGDLQEDQPRPTHWLGIYKGAILFDAEEFFSEFDCGHDNLTVTTRQLYEIRPAP
jgi:hypothetical protein